MYSPFLQKKQRYRNEQTKFILQCVTKTYQILSKKLHQSILKGKGRPFCKLRTVKNSATLKVDKEHQKRKSKMEL